MRPRTREIPTEPPSTWTGVDVRLLRRHLGLSQTTLASLLAVDRCTVTQWERDHRPPSEPCCRLLDILDSNPEVFGEGVGSH
jgi:DNA-binding transcriptional regulator YiaG